MIDGVSLIPLTTYPDERGWFREVARASQLPAAPVQLSHSFMHAGTIKAWHYHLKQWDWWYVVSGRLKVALFDLRVDLEHIDVFPLELQDPRLDWQFSPTPTAGNLNEFILEADQPPLIKMAHEDGQQAWVKMRGRTHNMDGPVLLSIPPGVAHGCKALSGAHLLYLTSCEYDGSDEGRLAHDDPAIGYDWLKGPESNDTS